MCGSNNLGESDRHPLEVCPQCVAKICWATSADPQKRFTHLADFCRKHSLVDEADFYEKSAAAVEKRK